jgi:signal transduction histidine kinase
MTPLTAIRGYQEQLAKDVSIRASAALSKHVAVIGEETLRVERIVRDLLDLARLEGGGSSLDMQDVSIEALFGRVAARHDAEARSRGARLTTHIDAGAEIVYGDPFRLEQALQNLAANALRHVGEAGEVRLDARLEDGHLLITVRDDGNGISEEHLPFIFDRFYKVDPSRVTASAGSGLGLSIVKAIIERHGGTVTVASTVGLGTVFIIQIPASALVTVL